MTEQNEIHDCEFCVDDDTRTAHVAFDRAIAAGRLNGAAFNTHGADPLYAGDFMYMGSFQGKDQFKNRNTRKYLD